MSFCGVNLWGQIFHLDKSLSIRGVRSFIVTKDSLLKIDIILLLNSRQKIKNLSADYTDIKISYLKNSLSFGHSTKDYF